MIYSKKALALEDQADLLLQRGLLADRGTLISRLSGYLHPFRKKDALGNPIDDWRAHALWKV